VPIGRVRDLDELGPRIEQWLAAHDRAWLAAHDRASAPHLVSLEHASAGWANETVIVKYVSADEGRDPRRVVVRLAPVAPTFPDDDLVMQGRVQEAVHDQGVPTAAPVTVETDESWLGAPFLVMPFLDGHVPGEIPALDPWLSGCSSDVQSRLMETFIEGLVAIHSVDLRVSGLGECLRGANTPLEDEVAWWEGYVHWASEGNPLRVVAEGLEWCRSHLPRTVPEHCLLWGDARLGNIVVSDEGLLEGVLDWDMASIGPPEMDLGWFLALDWAGEQLVGKRPPGFPGHESVVSSYEERIGRKTEDLEWYELFALVRSLAINNRQARLAREAGVRYISPADERNPLAGLLKRRLEMIG